MKKAHLRKLVALYSNKLYASRESEKRNHVIWMVCQLISLKERGKLNRWIGFIQGYCWTNGLFSIDDMRWHVKGEFPAKCRHECITRGPAVRLTHGMSDTDVCHDCGAYRTLHHKPGPWMPGPAVTEEDGDE